MAYEFKTLGSVEALTEIPENANALVEVDGAIKRVPGGALGGSGGEEIFILQYDPESNVFSFNEDASLKIIDIIVQGGFPAIILNISDGSTYDSGRVTSLNFYHGSLAGSGDFLTIYFTGSNLPPEINLMLENNVFTGTYEPS